MKKELVQFYTVGFTNAKKWIVIFIIGLIAYYPFKFDFGAIAIVVSFYFLLAIGLTALFNSVKSLKLDENNFVFSDDKDEISYKNLEFFLIGTYCGDLLVYKNEKKNTWFQIPTEAFNSSLEERFFNNYVVERLPISQGILNSGGSEEFFVRSVDEMKRGYRKRDIFSKKRAKINAVMKNRVVPQAELQLIGKSLYEKSDKEKLIIKNEGLVINGITHAWEKLEPIKVSKNLTSEFEIKNKYGEEPIFKARGLAISKIPLFEKLYNLKVEEHRGTMES